MIYGEKGISVLAKTLIIMIMFVRQNPYSDMNIEQYPLNMINRP